MKEVKGKEEKERKGRKKRENEKQASLARAVPLTVSTLNFLSLIGDGFSFKINERLVGIVYQVGLLYAFLAYLSTPSTLVLKSKEYWENKSTFEFGNLLNKLS